MSGWYEGRKVDISNTEKYYKNRNIELFPNVKKFFSEFSGIAGNWYININHLGYAPDFTFYLFPYPPEYKTDVTYFMFDDKKCLVYSKDYNLVTNLAHEKIVLVGEIGYYYPACVWIGESGKLYATHEYDEKVHIYQSIIELIADELLSLKMDFITMEL